LAWKPFCVKVLTVVAAANAVLILASAFGEDHVTFPLFQ